MGEGETSKTKEEKGKILTERKEKGKRKYRGKKNGMKRIYEY